MENLAKPPWIRRPGLAQPEDRKKYDLDQLLALITRRNLHKEINFSGPVGKEFW